MDTLIKVLKSLRMAEAFLVSGFLFMGGFFGIFHAGFYCLKNFALFVAASYLLMLSVYSMNSFLGFQHDKSNPRLNNLNHFSEKFYLFTAIAFYGISFVLSLLANSKYIYFHPVIFTLWFLYSAPGYGKHQPVVGTVIHFVVAIIQFVFAYSFFNPLNSGAFLISCYPALLFSAGHLHHEIIDYEADAANKINSSAVKWGITKMKYFSLGLFVLSYIFLSALFCIGVINLEVYAIFGLTTGFQILFFFLLNSKFEQNFKSRLLYRLSYRILFLISGLSFAVYVLIESGFYVF